MQYTFLTDLPFVIITKIHFRHLFLQDNIIIESCVNDIL